jgi:hypothetical protein
VRKVGLVGLPVLAMILASCTSRGTPPTSSGAARDGDFCDGDADAL